MFSSGVEGAGRTSGFSSEFGYQYHNPRLLRGETSVEGYVWESDAEPGNMDICRCREQAVRAGNGQLGSEKGLNYSKTLATVQSSGMGKPRLAGEICKTVFIIGFTLRSPKSLSYPKWDGGVLDFLTHGAMSMSQGSRPY